MTNHGIGDAPFFFFFFSFSVSKDVFKRLPVDLMPYPKTLENAIGNVIGPNASLIVEGSFHKIDPAPPNNKEIN